MLYLIYFHQHLHTNNNKMYEYITFIKEVLDERSMMTVYWTKSLQYYNTFSCHNHNVLDITFNITFYIFYLISTLNDKFLSCIYF